MQQFASDVVMQDYEARIALKDRFLTMEPIAGVAAFYEAYPFLLPAVKVRLDKYIGAYLKLKPRTLRMYRKRLGLEK